MHPCSEFAFHESPIDKAGMIPKRQEGTYQDWLQQDLLGHRYKSQTRTSEGELGEGMETVLLRAVSWQSEWRGALC